MTMAHNASVVHFSSSVAISQRPEKCCETVALATVTMQSSRAKRIVQLAVEKLPLSSGGYLKFLFYCKVFEYVILDTI